MRRQDHFGTTLDQIIDGWEGFTDAGIVSDCSIFLAEADESRETGPGFTSVGH
jgi:hypothetical protein